MPIIEIIYLHNVPDAPYCAHPQCYVDGELKFTGKLIEKTAYHSDYEIDDWRRKQRFGPSQWGPKHNTHVYENDCIVDPEKFNIEIECYHWSCGDGCCSDSGYEGFIDYDGYRLRSWDYWGDNHRVITDEDIAHKIKEVFGIEIGITKIKINRIDSEDDEADEEGGRRTW